MGEEGGSAGTPVEDDAAAPRDAGPGDGEADGGAPEPQPVRFALLGDFGFDDENELAVAQMIAAYDPEFIVTLGDNSYPDSTPETIDETIGKYYAKFIHPYRGKYGKGASAPRFFACLGNHDWGVGNVKAHEDYFDLPGNERYWEIAKGPVRILCVDSDTHEPDGTTPTSVQGNWLRARLAASAADPFRLVVFHHPAHSSGQHGSQPYMQWPFEQWGASAVYTGHDHHYERFDFGPGSIPYVVQGTGGADLREVNASRAGSVMAYKEKHGATFVEASERYAVFSALTVGLDRVDEHVLTAPAEERRETDVIVAGGATLRYWDTGPVPSGWQRPSFDASAWKSGAMPVGYGQGDERTTIARGLVHYARVTFELADPGRYDHLVVWLRRDDGVALSVNGAEGARSNLPPGALTPATLASTVVGHAAENAWLPFVIPRRSLVRGTNVLALELHQASAESSDAILDVRVEGKR